MTTTGRFIWARRAAMATAAIVMLALTTGAARASTAATSARQPAAPASSLEVAAHDAATPDAMALANVLTQSERPIMGWTSWTFMRHDPTEAGVEAQAKAMVTSGLKSVGYEYVNVDDSWYDCPGPEGPTVDQYGRWVINTTKFPSHGSVNGIEATANYVHHLGLKFGIYLTPGISEQAVAENTPVQGTRYTADQIATKKSENNYDCHGMVGLNYSRPGAQAFIDSWADELAHWGVDYVKLDGVGTGDIPDIIAWSRALRQTGRRIQLDLANDLQLSDANTWRRYAQYWRTGGDIDCYCSQSSVFPLTDWYNVATRFDEVADWAPYARPGLFNDYDSIEVGNGAQDGLTPPERQTQLSLWALGASPLILGSDLTHLTPQDRGYLLNRSVISVDQDGIDAHRVMNTPVEQVFTKRESSGTVIVGIFNRGSSAAELWTSTSALGLSSRRDYDVRNLWTGQLNVTTGRIGADVASHGVAFYRVTPVNTSPHRRPYPVAPLTALGASGPTVVTGGETITEEVRLTDAGPTSLHGVQLSLTAPTGWAVSPQSSGAIASVAPGQTVTASFTVVAPAATQTFSIATLTAGATDQQQVGGATTLSSPFTVTVQGPTVQAPFDTYTSTTDAVARFSQVGNQLAIEGAGSDLYTTGDDYSAIYQPGVVSDSTTVTTELTGLTNLYGFAKAGIMIRNSIAQAGSSPEGVILYDSPTAGLQLGYDNDAGDYINVATPPLVVQDEIHEPPPLYLQLTRTGDTYTGSWSSDGVNWLPIAQVTIPGQAPIQDAGLFETSQSTSLPGIATFNGFDVEDDGGS